MEETNLKSPETNKNNVLQSKKDKPFQCSECSAKFTRKDRLTAHIKQKHSPVLNNTFPCLQCAASFNRKDRLTTHVKYKHTDISLSFKCNHCKLQYNNSHELKDHIIKNHKLFKCIHCESKFTRKDNLSAHMKLKHSCHTFQSLQCAASFNRKDRLTAHVRNKHTDISFSFKCNHCKLQFNNSHELKNHIIKDHKLFKCIHCESKFNRKDNLSAHMKLKHSCHTFQCLECAASFITKDKLSVHVKQKHTEMSLSSFKCSHCKLEFNYFHELKNHKIKEHKQFFINCIHCKSKFTRTDNLNAHMTLKHRNQVLKNTNKLFECFHCHAKFTNKYRLSVHMKQTHNPDEMNFKEKLYKCRLCNLSTPRKDLLLHYKNVHCYEITESGSFPDKVHVVKKHNVTITTKYSELFICERCGIQFHYLKSLRTHQAKKHNLTLARFNTNFEAIECSAKYSRKNHLQSYMNKKHREEQQNLRLYNCALCSFAATKGDLLHHFAHVHNIDIEVHKKTFQDLKEFEEWKRQEEKESLSSFIKDCQLRNTNASGETTFYGYYTCHRSGYYTPRANSLRRLKAQGSKKIGGYCPANMKVVRRENGPCKLEYTKTHVGHDDDLCHLFLNQEEKEILACQLAVKKPFEEILQDVRNSVTESERLHLLSKKDLHNINKSFKISRPTCNLQTLEEAGALHVSNQQVFDEVRTIHESNQQVLDGVRTIHESTQLVLEEVRTIHESNQQVLDEVRAIHVSTQQVLEEAGKMHVSDISDSSKYVQLYEPQEVEEEICEFNEPVSDYFCIFYPDGNDSIVVNDIPDSQEYNHIEVIEAPYLESSQSQSVSPERLGKLKNNFLQMIDSVSNAGELSVIENSYEMVKSELNAFHSCIEVPESSLTASLHNLVNQLGINSAKSDHPQLQ